MTSQLLWSLIAIQIALGAFDTLYHHEMTERLAWRASQQHELQLHGARNLLYAALFVALGWFELHGAVAVLVLGVLVVELVITLMDFVEEDASRKLPASERVTHALLALNYGAILVMLIPVLLGWASVPTDILSANYGLWSWLAAIAASCVAIFGIRDLHAAARAPRLETRPAGGLVTALPLRQSILVTGGTGFVGARLIDGLVSAGHDVIVLTRSAAKAGALNAPISIVTNLDQIPSDRRIDAIVNLAGEPIADGLWTQAKRRRIVQSRVQVTRRIVQLMARLEHKPGVLISGSAIGWYGMRSDEMLTEESEAQACFSHEVCSRWENEAAKVADAGVRVVFLRIGLVLGTAGGMLARLLVPFEFGLGGRIGSGHQWMSWIELDDLVRLIAHAIATPNLFGVVNATAPEPVRNCEFARALAHALHRPSFLPVPALPLKVLGGDFAKELLLGGQRVVPKKALASAFTFRYPELPGALAAMLGTTRQRKTIHHPEAPHRLSLG